MDDVDLPIDDEDLAELDALEERRLQLIEEIELVDARQAALAEIERRSAAMLEAQQHSSLRGI